MAFTDSDLDLLKQFIDIQPDWTYAPVNIGLCKGLIERMLAAERKDCNQFHCGHQTCNEWRKVAGK